MDQHTPDLPTPDATPPDAPPPDAPPPDASDATEVPTDSDVESATHPIANPDSVTDPSEMPASTATRREHESEDEREERREERIGARLQRLVGDEPVLAWTQGWVSREVRLHRLLAARTLDFAVVTDRSLSLFSTGFFTRRPRRRVYNSRFERIFVADDAVARRRRRRRLRITSRDAKPLWLELDGSGRAGAFAAELTTRAKTSQP